MPAGEPVMAREQTEALHDEIGQLPPAPRLSVDLCYFEGLTVEEAAARGYEANLKPAAGRVFVARRVLGPTGVPVANPTVMVYASLKWPRRDYGLAEMSLFALGQAGSDGSGRCWVDDETVGLIPGLVPAVEFLSTTWEMIADGGAVLGGVGGCRLRQQRRPRPQGRSGPCRLW
jgi:hypothetical protein